MIAGEIVFAAPLVAGKARNCPGSRRFFRRFRSIPPTIRRFRHTLHRLAFLLQHAGLRLIGPSFKLSRFALHSWWEPVRRLRRELGLKPGGDPLFKDKFSAELILALFSAEIARPQPDWPPNTVQPGYLFYDQDEAHPGCRPNSKLFFRQAMPPIVFTLGSSAVHDPRGFFDESAEACRNSESARRLPHRRKSCRQTGSVQRQNRRPLRAIFRAVSEGGGRRPSGRKRHNRAGPSRRPPRHSSCPAASTNPTTPRG